jgi:hypothetical protein
MFVVTVKFSKLQGTIALIHSMLQCDRTSRYQTDMTSDMYQHTRYLTKCMDTAQLFHKLDTKGPTLRAGSLPPRLPFTNVNTA